MVKKRWNIIKLVECTGCMAKTDFYLIALEQAKHFIVACGTKNSLFQW
jgi:hypothetical protein